MDKIKVLVAGIAGASLGTEIIKSLASTNKYEVYGCDISPLAYGHFDGNSIKTFLVDKKSYISSIVDICKENKISLIIPGGEEPMVLLNKSKEDLYKNDLKLLGNDEEVIALFSDKEKTFEQLKQLGFNIPSTIHIKNEHSLEKLELPLPCVVKPALGTGGSNFVYLAATEKEAKTYIKFLLEMDKKVIVQEYLSEEDGEYTVGVLSFPNGEIAGSIVLQRVFNSKLSVSIKTETGLISSGYSQGFIGDFPKIKETCERIALAIKSKGPLNIQGRIKDGEFIPFEINPRFSASTYLRTLAGFNEIDLFINHILFDEQPEDIQIKAGYYLRGFDQVFVGKEEVNID